MPLMVNFGREFESRYAEAITALGLGGWGWSVIGNHEVFAMPFYEPLKTVAGPDAWGTCFLLVGVFWMFALIVNGSWYRTPLIRQLGCVCGIILWSFLLMASMSVAWRSPTSFLYLMGIALNAVSLMYATRDNRIMALRNEARNVSDGG